MNLEAPKEADEGFVDTKFKSTSPSHVSKFPVSSPLVVFMCLESSLYRCEEEID